MKKIIIFFLLVLKMAATIACSSGAKLSKDPPDPDEKNIKKYLLISHPLTRFER